MSAVLELALDLIRDERRRQDARFGVETCASATMDERLKLAVLLEEVGEVARVLNEQAEGRLVGPSSRERLLAELVQVGAVTCAWVEAFAADLAELDREPAR